MRRVGLPIRRLLVLAVLLGAPAVGGWVWWSRAHRPSEMVARGLAAYDRGEWESAAALAVDRLEVARDDPDALRLLARASFRLGRDPAGASLYRRLEESTYQAEDLYLMGQAVKRAGRPKDAVMAWERARSIDPRHAETLFELARAYLASGRLEDAARAAADLAERPGWESRAEGILGEVRLARNDPAGAVESWRRALAGPSPAMRAGAIPSTIVSRTEFARALLRAGRPEEARDQLRVVLDESPGPQAYWLMSRADLQLRDWPGARADLERGGPFAEEDPMRTEPAPYVGASRCAGCHPAESQAQQASRHARTFRRAPELGDLPLPDPPVPDPEDPSVVHSLRRDSDGRIRQQTRAAGLTYDAVVQYAFGSGDRGLTLVGRDPAGHAFELRLSDYPERQGQGPGAKTVSRWDLTMGQLSRPGHANEYLGKPLTEDKVRQCLGCHVTDAKAIVDGSGACSSDRAIGCERCHGPGGHHLLAVEGGLVQFDPAIGRPNLTSGARVVKLCAECHSPLQPKLSTDDPDAAVRFQGTTLTWSRCYLESGNTLDCTTCHDPHRNASGSAAHYVGKCLGCHSSDTGADRARASGGVRARETCPVNPSGGCIGCHMPAVGGIVPHSTFTDHFIRVHRR